MIWLYRGFGLESFGTSSKRNVVCVGEPRCDAAQPGTAAAVPAALEEKQVKIQHVFSNESSKFLH